MGRLPYNQIDSVDYRYIRQIRFARNKSLKDMEELMGVSYTVISRLENGQIAFSPLYQDKFKTACKRLRVSNLELVSIRKLLEQKELKGYK